MPITGRNLPPGATLTARYKGTDHTLLVLESDGELAFELNGGTIYPSLSAAGSAVMGGTACNGWRFWSRQDDGPTTDNPQPRTTKSTRSRPRRAKRPRRDTYADWTDDRLRARVASIERDLPALEGEVLEQSQADLDLVKAGLARRSPADASE